MSNALENARKEGETRDKYKQTFKQYGIPLDPYVTYSTEELNCVGNMVAEKKKELEDADRREEARNLIATFDEVLSKLSTSKKTNQALDKYKKLDELAFYTDVTTVKSVSRDFFRENWPSVNKNTQKMLDAYYLNSLNDRKVAIKYLTDLEEYHTACANDPKADKEIRKKSGVFIKNFIQILKLKEQVMDEKLKEGP
jgi:hypothetical protein